MALDQTLSDYGNEPEVPGFLTQLNSHFEPGSLTNGLREDLETLSALTDQELNSKGLTRARVERAVRRKYIQSLYG